MVVASSSGTVDAYDAASGKLLWQLTNLQGNHIASASIAGDSLFVGAAPPVHGSFDADQVAATNCRIELTDRDDQPHYKIRWKAGRANANYLSPLAFAGYVYYVNKSGILYCLDAETGQEFYRERLGDACWASPVGVTTNQGQSLVYFVLKNGETLVLQPGPDFEEVARNVLWNEGQLAEAAKAARRQREQNRPTDKPVPAPGSLEARLARLPEQQLHKMFSYGDPVVYAVAVADGRLLIRTGQRLYCIATE